MKNKFIILDVKKFSLPFFVILILLLTFAFRNDIVKNVMEASSNYRLLPIYSVEKEDKVVSLTFDCAWGADDIEDIIKTLQENDIKATFFAVGDWIKKYPEAVKKLHDSGMTIGNHSDSHSHVNKMSFQEVLDDIKKCNDKIEEITCEKVKFYRGPYGEYNNTVISVAESLNMKVIQWDIDTLDYNGKTAAEMCKRIKSKIRNGSIILMHNDTKYTASRITTNNKYDKRIWLRNCAS